MISLCSLRSGLCHFGQNDITKVRTLLLSVTRPRSEMPTEGGEDICQRVEPRGLRGRGGALGGAAVEELEVLLAQQRVARLHLRPPAPLGHLAVLATSQLQRHQQAGVVSSCQPATATSHLLHGGLLVPPPPHRHHHRRHHQQPTGVLPHLPAEHSLLSLQPGAGAGAASWEAVQCSAVQCSAVQCGAVQCSAVRCSTVQCSAL